MSVILHLIYKAAQLSRYGIAAILSCALLVACFEEETTGVSMIGANHTGTHIVEVSTTGGRSGMMTVLAHGTSGNICCVTIPAKWRPDLTATISWQNESTSQKDAKGDEVLNDGKPILTASPRKSKTVPIPKYDSAEDLYVHFFPNDEVKLVVSKYGPGHPKHGLPSPYIPGLSR
jgi:Protein of unknown function (DUF3304)